jgi:Methyltransferase domain
MPSFTYADWLATYRSTAVPEVEGWLNGNMYPVLQTLNAIQRDLGVRGGIAEIGVHHGRFFMPLNAMVEPEEGTSFAIDLFEDQARNIDNSGKGNQGKFRENLARFDRHLGRNVACIQGDSTRLPPAELVRLREARPKAISVDGGHTVEHTLSDLELASSCVHEGGAVFLDDVPSQHWIGVMEGAICYLQRRPTLWPVLIGFNKMILVPMSVHEHYLAAYRSTLTKPKMVTLCGYRMFSVLPPV